MEMRPKVGGGCKPRGINDPTPGRYVLPTPLQRDINIAARKIQHDAWLKTPEGIEYAQKEQERAAREAKKLTQSQWDTIFNEMLAKGFQPGDTAVLDPEVKGIKPTVHGKTGRQCVYVQISNLIDLYDRPKWMINPAHWRGALVCFLEGADGKELNAVECLRRGPNSAWGKVVNERSAHDGQTDGKVPGSVGEKGQTGQNTVT